ncbi:unnamed protein product [Amoebophrya sp. A120]|nr:unnamed protein product [Amoebophrya sp. A120]|eukprot:GSA120T00020023001.1
MRGSAQALWAKPQKRKDGKKQFLYHFPSHWYLQWTGVHQIVVFSRPLSDSFWCTFWGANLFCVLLLLLISCVVYASGQGLYCCFRRAGLLDETGSYSTSRSGSHRSATRSRRNSGGAGFIMNGTSNGNGATGGGATASGLAAAGHFSNGFVYYTDRNNSSRDYENTTSPVDDSDSSPSSHRLAGRAVSTPLSRSNSNSLYSNRTPGGEGSVYSEEDLEDWSISDEFSSSNSSSTSLAIASGEEEDLVFEKGEFELETDQLLSGKNGGTSWSSSGAASSSSSSSGEENEYGHHLFRQRQDAEAELDLKFRHAAGVRPAAPPLAATFRSPGRISAPHSNNTGNSNTTATGRKTTGNMMFPNPLDPEFSPIRRTYHFYDDKDNIEENQNDENGMEEEKFYLLQTRGRGRIKKENRSDGAAISPNQRQHDGDRLTQ